MNQPTATRTFLFTDIEGSTRLWSVRTGEMSAALARHDRLLRDLLCSNGGEVFKTVGDAFCVAFESPTEALVAALAMQRGLAAEDWRAFGTEFPGLRVRIAIHHGEAEVRDGDYYGPPVNRVARLLGAGHGGQVLFSGTAASLLGGRLPPEVTLLDLGDHRLKDLSRPERIYQLVAPGLEADFPPLRTLERHRTNLPIQPTSFVGRERERAEVRRLLAEARLVTLTGAGGSGKTRLALQVAAEMLDELPDGAWFVDLAPIVDPDLVLGSLAVVLGLREQPGRLLVETVMEHLKPRDLLLVLDNCEHLLAALAPLAHGILATASGVRILATSRERLAVGGERVWPVPTLELPAPPTGPIAAAELEALVAHEAVALFIDRARSAKADFDVTVANIGAIVEICSRLDGLPLAIELAAARARLLAPEQIRVHLEERFALLTSGGRTALPRQQTLRGAIDWSYDLLSEREREVFVRCGVFRGSWDLAAARAVCGDEELDDWAIVDLLGHLVDKSLVVRLEDAAGTARYGYLETIAEYARERLVATGVGEISAARARHLSHYLAVAQAADLQIGRATLASPLTSQRLVPDVDNLRSAFDWATSSPETMPAGVRLGAALTSFWTNATSWVEAQQLFARLARLEAGDQVAHEQARLMYADAGLRRSLMRDDEVLPILEEVQRRARALGDEQLESWVLNSMAGVAGMRGESARAIQLQEASIALKRRVAPAWDVAIGLTNLAIHHELVDQDRAAALYQDVLALADASPDAVRPRQRTSANVGLGDIAFRRGEFRRAASHFAAAASLANALEENWIGRIVARGGWLATSSGRHRAAACLIGVFAASERMSGVAIPRTSTGTPHISIRDLHASIVSACREALGDEAFDAELAAGHEIPLEEGLTLAETEFASWLTHGGGEGP